MPGEVTIRRVPLGPSDARSTSYHKAALHFEAFLRMAYGELKGDVFSSVMARGELFFALPNPHCFTPSKPTPAAAKKGSGSPKPRPKRGVGAPDTDDDDGHNSVDDESARAAEAAAFNRRRSEFSSTPVGCVAFLPAPGPEPQTMLAAVPFLFVLPAARHRGVGTQLLGSVVTYAASLSFIGLTAVPGGAAKFWRRAGFLSPGPLSTSMILLLSPGPIVSAPKNASVLSPTAPMQSPVSNGRGANGGFAVDSAAPFPFVAPFDAVLRPPAASWPPAVVRGELRLRMARPSDHRAWSHLVVERSDYDFGGADMVAKTFDARFRCVVVPKGDDGRLLGLIAMTASGWLPFLAVAADAGSGGVGSLLLAVGLEWLRVQGMRECRLTPISAKIVKYYTDRGFVVEKGGKNVAASDMVLSRPLPVQVPLLPDCVPLRSVIHDPIPGLQCPAQRRAFLQRHSHALFGSMALSARQQSSAVAAGRSSNAEASDAGTGKGSRAGQRYAENHPDLDLVVPGIARSSAAVGAVVTAIAMRQQEQEYTSNAVGAFRSYLRSAVGGGQVASPTMPAPPAPTSAVTARSETTPATPTGAKPERAVKPARTKRGRDDETATAVAPAVVPVTATAGLSLEERMAGKLKDHIPHESFRATVVGCVKAIEPHFPDIARAALKEHVQRIVAGDHGFYIGNDEKKPIQRVFTDDEVAEIHQALVAASTAGGEDAVHPTTKLPMVDSSTVEAVLGRVLRTTKTLTSRHFTALFVEQATAQFGVVWTPFTHKGSKVFCAVPSNNR